MVALTHKHIQVYATEKEAQSLCLAANCHSKPDNLHYIESQDNLTDFDTIIDINLLTASTN